MAARQEPGAEPPDTASLGKLRRAARACRGCGLYRDATATVFGVGAERADIFALGEQPGDQEDRRGEPFVGPAGKLLGKALGEAGLDRDSLYLTNAVKHFKFKLRGKRRIHEKPARSEIVACRPWLVAELRAVRPRLVLLLGATAAQSVYGSGFRLTRHRGEPLDPPEEFAGMFASAVATVHPSAVLRAPDRDTAYDEFVADLRGL
ncbi:UdgX family uracil-DNA binding protein [Amycolatopsis rubida]|uniref:Type-4 uracil-DNA glycosylase n=1 Tax=Amycolatopsis rubida TaxID=112413 RepID=A0A1I5LKR2_9PSEU|nr:MULTISPECIES: UdgX family uracil-DNA binding protein [Amycolatopsis]MYW93916.1 UdgX family uracil-DNA binding protein [Amycolatopsis rubida]NEC58905.1 UdgX family uracil-DNA binding protein [Amycolatopsis rubida]OAP25411.1 Uracil DNA glycosylase superfamily protein [Amycolatopsis sp. M39]SFO97908.1 DNA polymerase [Amycolatopsis rubida]